MWKGVEECFNDHYHLVKSSQLLNYLECLCVTIIREANLLLITILILWVDCCFLISISRERYLFLHKSSVWIMPDWSYFALSEIVQKQLPWPIDLQIIVSQVLHQILRKHYCFKHLSMGSETCCYHLRLTLLECSLLQLLLGHNLTFKTPYGVEPAYSISLLVLISALDPFQLRHASTEFVLQ